MVDWASDRLLLFGAAIAVDLLAGEPPPALHPVVWIGKATRLFVRLVPRSSRWTELIGGGCAALLIPAGFALGAAELLAETPWRWAQFAAGVWLLKSTFALGALREAIYAVRDALFRNELAEARQALRSLCSRDSSHLDPQAVAAAAIESAAENASDSLIAPLFYYVLLGVPGAVFYRAVNTLDAMIGYRGTYEYLGKAAARLDDLCNLLPARLTAWLLLLSGRIAGGDWRDGWRMARRDHGRTESPNAGWPMAAMAGLLRVRLEKAGHYALGDAREELTVSKIDEAWRMVAVTSLIACGMTAALLGMRHVARAIG
ncbi:MAG: adenosylcobinamide-phosphate synthase CbiB [Caulobacterales bacterium]